MSETKFTTGPWAVWPMGRVLAITCTGRTKPHPSEGMHVAAVHMPEHNTQHDDLWKSNANLIASAPELYEALVDLIGWIPGPLHYHSGDPERAVERARAALAKARGEQP